MKALLAGVLAPLFRLGPIMTAIALLAAEDPLAPKPGIPPGFVLVGGDILVRAASRDGIRLQSPFPSSQESYWPSGIVPYQFDANVSTANQRRMIDAMSTWQAVAGVTFRPRTDEGDFVHIQNSTVNNSSIGRIKGEQFVNITDWWSHRTLVHELGHCLGLGHTQTRSDRDQFVQILWDNIAPTNRHNFTPTEGFRAYGPYDFASVMHYEACTFSTCTLCVSTNTGCATIVALPPYFNAWQTRMGTLPDLSFWDQRLMSFLYPFANWRFADEAVEDGPQEGTFFDPFHTFVAGHDAVPVGGTLWLQPGTYTTGGILSKPVTLQAPLGGVTLVP